MQGAMFGLRVPINIANAFKMTAGEGTDLNWIDVGDARHHGVGLPLMAAYGLQEIWIARQPTYHSDMMEHMPNVSRFIDGAGRVYLDEDGDVAVTLYGEADQLVKEIIGAHLEEVRMALKALPNREDSVTLNTLGGDIAKIGAMPARKAEADMNGTMFGLAVPMQIAKELAIPGGEPPDLMHITLAYFKDAAADRDDWDQAIQIGKQFNFNLFGEITGYGTFDNDEVVLWAQPEVPGLAEEREKLVAALNKAGFPVDDRFPDFKPHITIAYDWQGDVPELEQPIPVTFDGLYFYRGERVEKVAAGTQLFLTDSMADTHGMGLPFMYDPSTKKLFVDTHSAYHYTMFNKLPVEEFKQRGENYKELDLWAGRIYPNGTLLSFMGNNEEIKQAFRDVWNQLTPVLNEAAQRSDEEETPHLEFLYGEDPENNPRNIFSKTASKIVRMGEGSDEFGDADIKPSPNLGFEKGARAFAYDPTTDTIYTHTGHHPDIVHELYGGERYTPEYEESFKRAAEDYL